VSVIDQTAGRPFPRAAVAASHAGTPADRPDSLTRAFAGGIAWTASARWSAQAVSWGATLVVARFLSPADYGLVAMATVFIGLVAIVNEFGVGMTVVTLRDLSDEQIAQLHGLALVVGAINAALSLALAPLVAAFFGRPELVGIISLLGVTFVAAGLRTVPIATLQRSFRYRALAAIESTQAVIAALAALAGALAGAGYWALVVSQLAAAIVWTAAATVTAPARLAWPRRRTLGGAFDFTRHQLTGSIAWYCYSSSDFIVAGRVLGAVELGTYSLAWTFARIVPERLANVVIGVAPSFLAAVRDDLPVLRQWIYRLTEAMALVTFPMLVGIALTAPDLVHLAVGDRWQGDAASIARAVRRLRQRAATGDPRPGRRGRRPVHRAPRPAARGGDAAGVPRRRPLGRHRNRGRVAGGRAAVPLGALSAGATPDRSRRARVWPGTLAGAERHRDHDGRRARRARRDDGRRGRRADRHRRGSRCSRVRAGGLVLPPRIGATLAVATAGHQAR